MSFGPSQTAETVLSFPSIITMVISVRTQNRMTAWRDSHPLTKDLYSLCNSYHPQMTHAGTDTQTDAAGRTPEVSPGVTQQAETIYSVVKTATRSVGCSSMDVLRDLVQDGLDLVKNCLKTAEAMYQNVAVVLDADLSLARQPEDNDAALLWAAIDYLYELRAGLEDLTNNHWTPTRDDYHRILTELQEPASNATKAFRAFNRSPLQKNIGTGI